MALAIIHKMKQITFLLIILFPSLAIGQFPEIQKQRERAIAYNKVRTVIVYQYDYQDDTVDTTLLTLEKYNRSGNLIEKRYYSTIDTSSYSGVTYVYDSADYSVLEKPFEVNSPCSGCPYYQGHPRKKIEEANDKGQLIFVKEIRKEGILEKKYSYGDKGLLEQIKVKVDKKLYWIYEFHYEYYD